MEIFKKGVVLDVKSVGLKALEVLKEVVDFDFYEIILFN